jgi:uncharacterized phosphosugar-binding protein
MFLEHVEGLGAVIMRNFVFAPPDCFMIFTNSGINEVVVEIALEAKKRALPVIAVISVEHCAASAPKHSTGRKLPDVADVVIDNCVPAGDALVGIDGLPDPVGPGSTIGSAAVANMLKCAVADKLTRRGQPPKVLTSSYFISPEESKQRFDDAYDEYRRRLARTLGADRHD